MIISLVGFTDLENEKKKKEQKKISLIQIRIR
jgi:hypothetical protein